MNNIKCKNCGHDGFNMDKDGIFICTKCAEQMPINISRLMKGDLQND